MTQRGVHICECKGNIGIESLQPMTVPLDDGTYTEFYCGRCITCRGWAGFPEYNFRLALKKSKLFVQEMTKFGKEE